MTIILVMVRRVAFAIVYDRGVFDHLRAIERKHHALIRREIQTHLTYAPDLENRNRKPLARAVDFDADWELRLGPSNRYRVFYGIDYKAMEVQILAIGQKLGSRLFIGGQEISL